VKHSYLDQPIIARFIKIHVIHWNQHPSMRLELLGCQGNHTTLQGDTRNSATFISNNCFKHSPIFKTLSPLAHSKVKLQCRFNKKKSTTPQSRRYTTL